MRSFDELAEHYEEEGALARAETAYKAGKLEEAIGWLDEAGSTAGKRNLLAEVHYSLAKRELNARRFERSLEHLREVPRDGPVSPFLIEERIHLLQERPGPPVARVEASTCDNCAGDDLWRVATCSHQQDPLPPADKLDPTSLQPTITRVFAAGAYRPGYDRQRGQAATSLMRRLKKKVTRSVLEQLSVILASYVVFHTDLLKEVDVLVPIPSKGARTAARGESIPRVIAETLSRELCVPVRFALEAHREPKSHAEVRGEARKEELEDAWEAEEDTLLMGRTVLLVDDVTTTGATLQVAARLLKDAGVDTVHAAALQHTEKSS